MKTIEKKQEDLIQRYKVVSLLIIHCEITILEDKLKFVADAIDTGNPRAKEYVQLLEKHAIIVMEA